MHASCIFIPHDIRGRSPGAWQKLYNHDSGSMRSICIVLLFISSLPMTLTCLPRYGLAFDWSSNWVVHFGNRILQDERALLLHNAACKGKRLLGLRIGGRRERSLLRRGRRRRGLRLRSSCRSGRPI